MSGNQTLRKNRQAKKPGKTGTLDKAEFDVRISKWFDRCETSPIVWGLTDTWRSRLNQPTDLHLWEPSGVAKADPEQFVEGTLRILDSIYRPNRSEGDSLVTVSDSIRWLTSNFWASATSESPAFNYWIRQLQSVELSVCRSLILADHSSDDLQQSCRRQFTEFVTDWIDHDGLPRTELLPVLPQLVASWTRSHRIFAKSGIGLDSDASEVLEWFVRQLLRMLRPDGSFMLSPDVSPVSSEFKKYFLKMSSDTADKRLANACWAGTGKSPKLVRLPPEESDHSEWAQLAVMQSRWQQGAPKAALNYSNGRIDLEVCNQRCLIYGQATPSIQFNGQQLTPDNDIELVCWHSDDDVDYLEIQLVFDDKVTLQRQLILIRDDKALLIIDSLNANRVGAIKYECPIPLAPGIVPLAETETTEMYLETPDHQILSLVLPLALPEWKQERTDNRLATADGNLLLRQSGHGYGMCAPLFIDLDPERSLRPRTWRPLTVAEKLKIVSSDQAVAYRIQVDCEQWIFYRAIGEAANRTFIGENFSKDFFLGRLDRDGDVEELIQIEK